MYLSNEEIEELKKYIDGIYRDVDRMSSDGKYFLNKLDNFIDNLLTKETKVYVITNNAIFDDEIDYQIAGIAFDTETAQKIFQETIKNAKIDSDFENLDAIEIDPNHYYDEDAWMYYEDDKSFSLYLNGEYNSNNFSIEIKEYDVKDNNKEKDFCI